jgi:hypothetical protein
MKTSSLRDTIIGFGLLQRGLLHFAERFRGLRHGSSVHSNAQESKDQERAAAPIKSGGPHGGWKAAAPKWRNHDRTTEPDLANLHLMIPCCQDARIIELENPKPSVLKSRGGEPIRLCLNGSPPAPSSPPGAWWMPDVRGIIKLGREVQFPRESARAVRAGVGMTTRHERGIVWAVGPPDAGTIRVSGPRDKLPWPLFFAKNEGLGGALSVFLLLLRGNVGTLGKKERRERRERRMHSLGERDGGKPRRRALSVSAPPAP